jgi:hypothetical protein
MADAGAASGSGVAMPRVPTWLWVTLLLASMFVGAWFYPVNAQAPPIGQGGASPQPPFVLQQNHWVFGGPLVKLSGACGTAAAQHRIVNNGYDSGGFIAFGDDMMVGDVCIATFNRPFTFAVCIGSSYQQNIIEWSFNNVELSFKLTAPFSAPLAQPGVAYLCYDVRQP